MNQAKGIWFAVLSACGFGAMPIFANYAYRAGGDVITVLTGRFLFAAIALWVIVWVRKLPVRIGKWAVVQCVLLGMLGYAVVSFCYFASLKYISASMTAILLYLYPAFVTVLSLLTRQEKWQARKGVALFCSFFGLLMIVGLSGGQINLLGVLLGGAAGLLYSFFILVNRQVGLGLPVLTMTAFLVTGAFLAFAAIGLLNRSIHPVMAPYGYLAILAISLFSTVLGIWLFSASIQLIGPANASIISMFEPVFTILLGYLLFAERMTPLQMAGALMILLSLFILQLKLPNRTGKNTHTEIS
ncbi:DMT family transporter [Effusibacillus dendaii]|uniref:EamA domain-containing protein n=1 Tax=Effusibacillus dendaii TaxID=2743772 RepID=A0A7I8D8T0_9BACL|nr:DMT family transporter [Effusibacillus dendaii]BCJ86534.1 hypothetical protein skT53_15190 [Effusibacillus dendaii]